MKRTLSSALILGLLVFPAVGLVGCGEEQGWEDGNDHDAGWDDHRSSEIKVKSTGDNPPPNSAGQTGKPSR